MSASAGSSALDASAIEHLRAALAQWTIVAQAAEAAAHRAQREAVHALLLEARRVALGIESIDRLMAQHGAHGRAIASGRAGVATTLARLERRRAELSRLVQAAGRVNANSTHVQASIETVVSELTSVANAIVAATQLASRLEMAADRHGADDRELASLRSEFSELLAGARSALSAMETAGHELDVSRGLYEAAQLHATDLRQCGFPPPSGPPLEAPSTLAVRLVSA